MAESTPFFKVDVIAPSEFPHTDNVLSSAKLHMSHSSTKSSRSFMKILNRSGPRIEPWGTPSSIQSLSLRAEPTRTLCFLFEI